MYTLIGTAKLSDVDPQWLADVLHQAPLQADADMLRSRRRCGGAALPLRSVRQSGVPRTFLGRARTKAMRGRTGGLSSETISADEPYDSSTCAKASPRVSGIR